MIAGLVEILLFQASAKSSRDSWWPSFWVPWSGWSWRVKGAARPARSAVRSVARGRRNVERGRNRPAAGRGRGRFLWIA